MLNFDAYIENFKTFQSVILKYLDVIFLNLKFISSEDKELSVSDNGNIKLDDTLPNLNEENFEDYIKCTKYPLIDDENEEEDDQSYFNYENEHLTDKEVSDGDESQVKQFGDSDTNDVRFLKIFLEKNEDNIMVKF